MRIGNGVENLPRFFVSIDAVLGNNISIVGDDAFHIARALRMRTGEVITVCDDSRNEYECRLVRITDDAVTAEILSVKQSSAEPPYEVILYQALCKGDKFDTVVQKAVETGAAKIVPVFTSRCTVRPDAKALEGKTARWSRIAAEASKQCGRGTVVTVGKCVSFGEAIAEASKADLPLFCYEGDGTSPLPYLLERCKAPKTVSLIIGPEGGFEKSEANAACESGMLACGLGKRILRTETASTFVLSCLSYNYELRLFERKE